MSISLIYYTDMARGKLSIEDRLRIQVTKLKKGILVRDEKIQALEEKVSDLTQKLIDLGFQFEKMKEIVFGKKSAVKKILDDDDKKPPVSRNKESYQRPIPKDSEITDTVHHSLPPNASLNIRTKVFYCEDIPLNTTKIVTKHIIQQYHDGVSWVGTIPLPSCSVILGDNIRMLVTTLTVEQRLSYTQVQSLLLLLYKIQISQGEIAKILTNESSKLALASESLLESIQSEKCQHIDETSWDIKGEIHFAWSITGLSGSSYYTLGVSRGKGIAEQLRGNSNGVLISDDYGAYKNLAIHHQLCWAHLTRKLRDLAGHPDFEESLYQNITLQYQELKQIYRSIKETLEKPKPEEQKELYVTKLSKFAGIGSTDPPPLIRIKKTLQKNILKYLTCFHFPTIPLTNNRAEQSLRHLVIKRRISYGSTSKKGAQVLSILMTIVKELLRGGTEHYWERMRVLRVG